MEGIYSYYIALTRHLNHSVQKFIIYIRFSGIDLNNFASVVVIDEQLEKTSSAQNSSGQQSSSDGDGFQEVRNKKGAKKTDEPAISAGNASNQTGNQNQQALNQTSGQQQAAQQNQQRSSSTRGEKKERSSSKGIIYINIIYL